MINFFVKLIAIVTSKKVLIPAFIALLIALLTFTHHYAYSMGSKNEELKQSVVRYQLLQAQAIESQRIRDKDIEFLMEARDKEITIIERLQEIFIEVPTPDCKSLGDDWLREYNKSIGVLP